MRKSLNEKITMITNQKCWIEHTAIEQVEAIANWKDVRQIAALPDLHAGKTPIGVAVETENRIYPHLIGNDIGCGMGFYHTNIMRKKFKIDRMVTRLNSIHTLGELSCSNPYLEASPIPDLGTLGGGNHFAEFQMVDSILDKEAFSKLGLCSEEVFLLIHCGSRSYGQTILSEFLNIDGFSSDSLEGQRYLSAHNHALTWAQRNRFLVAKKLLDHLGYASNPQEILDCPHNYIEQRKNLFIHRKGAVSALSGAVILPGSRGSYTYLIMPAQDTSAALWSLSHGAGRKWARSLCKSRIHNKYTRDTIRQTKLKSQVVCHDTDLLFQEAPEAYKNIEHIIEALKEYNLIHIIAVLKPLITFKG